MSTTDQGNKRISSLAALSQSVHSADPLYYRSFLAPKNYSLKNQIGMIKSHGMTLQCTEFFRVFPCFSVAKSTRHRSKFLRREASRLYPSKHLTTNPFNSLNCCT
ncbi:secreted protein [Beggiatoa sp. SS]|nr:secreted protein [Beggiatoa sp. SS]